MKTGTLIVALLVAGVNIAGIVWLTGGVDSLDVADAKKSRESTQLPVSETGPWPKAVLPEPEHDFGVMAVGTEKSHAFVVKNEGEVPLKYKLIGTSCSCTVSDMEAGKVYEIPPGEHKEVKITWNPKDAESEFEKSVELTTDDPENRSLRFYVKGRVDQLVSVNPVGGWKLARLDRTTPETVTGEIISAVLDDFQIETIEATSDNIEVSHEPLPQETLETYNAKCGYRIKVVFDPKDLKLGKIEEKVTVHTDIEEAKEIPFEITGQFAGPITALPYRPPGAKTSNNVTYVRELLNINLGRFPASEGGKGWYKLVVAEMPKGEEFEITEIESSLDKVTATVKPISAPPQVKDRQFRVVTFEVEPGVAPRTYHRKKSVKIKMKTNHPRAPELKFYVEFIAI